MGTATATFSTSPRPHPRRSPHVSQALARFRFHVPQRGQVMPLPKMFAISNTTPIVRTNPNVTEKSPSNVRQVVIRRCGNGSHG
jgi:hypothetical protein